MLTIAICDDDSIFLNKFQHLLQITFLEHGYELEIDIYVKGKDLIEKIEKEKIEYDIIFLDIEMPILNGFQVAEKLRALDNKSILLFITNLDNEAPKGYHYQAV